MDPKEGLCLFSSFRARLIALCVAIVVAAMVPVALVNVMTTHEHTLAQLDRRMAETQQAELEAA